MKRIFLSLWPDHNIATEIQCAAQCWDCPSTCRRYATTDLHLTLHFIGAVPEAQLLDIQKCLHVPFEPFTLSLDAPRTWPGGLLVLCPATLPAALLNLHKDLSRALQALKLPVTERDFAPHVTLARRCEGMTVPQRCRPVLWRIEEYALTVSTGHPEQRYERIARYSGHPGRDHDPHTVF